VPDRWRNNINCINVKEREEGRRRGMKVALINERDGRGTSVNGRKKVETRKE
jgi:hypothetical protein